MALILLGSNITKVFSGKEIDYSKHYTLVKKCIQPTLLDLNNLLKDLRPSQKRLLFISWQIRQVCACSIKSGEERRAVGHCIYRDLNILPSEVEGVYCCGNCWSGQSDRKWKGVRCSAKLRIAFAQTEPIF